VVAVGVVLRFVAASPLWLDEALSANLADLPLGDLADALRHDGNPPLYFVILHGWTGIFGNSTGVVRALLDDSLHRPRWWSLAVVAAAGLWTSYTFAWLGIVAATAVLVAAVRARLSGDHDGFVGARNTLGALVVAAPTFVPGLPIAFYQRAHTGTPWAPRVRRPHVLVDATDADESSSVVVFEPEAA